MNFKLIGLASLVWLMVAPIAAGQTLQTIDLNDGDQVDACLTDAANVECATTKITLDDLVDMEIIKRDDAATVKDASGKSVAHDAALPSIDLNVEFDYDSYAIRGDQLPKIDAVAKAIAGGDFGTATFVLLGHTDQKGTADYNTKLSRDRAQSVAITLASVTGVPLDRFTVQGLGFSMLATPEDPFGPKNRRVQLVLYRQQ